MDRGRNRNPARGSRTPVLLDNAFKYTSPPGQVHVRAWHESSRARIDITDTGLGVPPEDWNKVFERFHRGRNARAATGTGLGLAIASWIAAQHGGTIELLSTPGDGSTFSLRLPMTEPG